MEDRALLVPAGEELHAAVGDRRLVERDPHPDHGRAEGVFEIGLVLVPGFFPAEARRLDQRHVLEHLGVMALQERF